jgi:hypothetical protein
MSSATEYRLNAARCLEVAERFSDPNEKTRMVLMAGMFFALADIVEQRAKLPPAKWMFDDAQ